MNERKPTWNCPVCDSKANYNDLLIDGYFLEVLESKDLPEEENEIILEQDGSWKPVPKDEKKEEEEKRKKKEEEEVACIDLSDDDEPMPRPPLPSTNNAQQPPLPPPVADQPPPPMPPAEIEIIDLD